MMVADTPRFVTTLLVAVVASACSATRQGGREVAPHPSPSWAQGEAAATARAQRDSARHPWTAADARFMSQMITHHAQAIAMAGMAPSHGASSSILTLAARIINAQEDEIALMQRWLRDRRQPVPEATPRVTNMHDGAGGHPMLMPGMLNAEEMAALDAARGVAFDRLFLLSMIKHHRGATAMVKELFSTDGAGQDAIVFKFASDVNVDQTTEIARMQRMLVALEFERRTP